MSMDLNGYRLYVRTLLDLDASEMPDLLVDAWVRSGFTAIARRINRWSFYQAEDSFTTVGGTRGPHTLGTVKDIERIVGPRGVVPFVDHSEAEARYLTLGAVSGPAEAYSVWNGGVYMWPTPVAAETFAVRGYRSPTDWMNGGAGAVPDLPADFHDVLLNYVVSQGHMFNEDPDLASVRMQQFTSGLEELLSSDQHAPEDTPIVVNGGGYSPQLLRPRLPWE